MPVTIHLTPMNEPLGRAIGNALEVEEAIATLQGEGPEDLVDLVVRLSGEGDRARAVLDAGSAFEAFTCMVRAQGGDLNQFPQALGCEESPLFSPNAGQVERLDALGIGKAVFVLGAGRKHAREDVHPGVGIKLNVKEGDTVEIGVEDARSYAEGALKVG